MGIFFVSHTHSLLTWMSISSETDNKENKTKGLSRHHWLQSLGAFTTLTLLRSLYFVYTCNTDHVLVKSAATPYFTITTCKQVELCVCVWWGKIGSVRLVGGRLTRAIIPRTRDRISIEQNMSSENSRDPTRRCHPWPTGTDCRGYASSRPRSFYPCVDWPQEDTTEGQYTQAATDSG